MDYEFLDIRSTNNLTAIRQRGLTIANSISLLRHEGQKEQYVHVYVYG